MAEVEDFNLTKGLKVFKEELENLNIEAWGFEETIAKNVMMLLEGTKL